MLSAAVPAAKVRRVRVRVEGTVQGVGFRPFVYRLARALSLGGHTYNDTRGVVIEAEGEAAAIEQFLARLAADAPPLAAVERVVATDDPVRGERGFTIRESASGGGSNTRIAPDVATCDVCLAELFDPADRRHRYPFINCTDCGPRLTIVRDTPYDRRRTTMADFTMCTRCQAEYEDPADRRFHAEPNACPACGPTARLVDGGGILADYSEADAVAAAARSLREGAIVAVKGLGGFHLACRADRDDVVSRLRQRKHREDKPFAIMVRTPADAAALIAMDPLEHALLVSRERPIVLARRRAGAPVAAAVAPRQRDLGVMLPATPLHHLLMADADMPLVMTSGNRSSEPIAFRNGDALERLGAIADLFLLHDREIETRVDDSVVRAVTLGGERRPLVIRRSRGWVPTPIPLPVACAPPAIGAGGQLKSTFTLARGAHAWVGQHIGDLDDFASRQAFDEGVDHLARLLSIAPARVAHDLHPDYHATHWALDRDELSPVGVQHHHAHLAACLAEHGECGPAIGVIWDGTGYGTDGTVWGGELLVGDLADIERAGHLWPVRMPGGDAAIREPWRMACAWLAELDGAPAPLPPALAHDVTPAQWNAVAGLAMSGVASPPTTSVGRLLDAIAAICGVRSRVTYEGQAAIELEMRAAAWRERVEPYPIPIHRTGDRIVLDPRELIRCVTADARSSTAVECVAARVHAGLIHAAVAATCEIATARAISTVVLAGGVFQNVLLLEGMAAALEREGVRVLVPRRLPPNDGGLSYGQVAVAAARAARAARG